MTALIICLLLVAVVLAFYFLVHVPARDAEQMNREIEPDELSQDEIARRVRLSAEAAVLTYEQSKDGTRTLLAFNDALQAHRERTE